jgi:hypothetical protein
MAQVELAERSASQSHFNDLCRLVGHPTPVEEDPTGKRFTFLYCLLGGIDGLSTTRSVKEEERKVPNGAEAL